MTKYSTCGYCNKEYNKNDDGAGYKYCSKECVRNIRNERRRQNNKPYEKVTLECEWCGEQYKVLKRYAYQSKYCSDECGQESYTREVRGHGSLEERRKAWEKQRLETQKRLKREREERKREVDCTECGNRFITYNPQQLTCTKKCSNRRKNRLSWQRESGRLNEDNIIDRDISLRVLYKRDGGSCYICGEQCNFDDHSTDGGHFTSGPSYPSIDHVVPIARGGKHAWDNVKLAHHRCNSLKSDQLPSDFFGEDVVIDKQEAYALASTTPANTKTVEQYTTNKELVEVYESAAEASRQLNIKAKGIRRCARGESKTYKGYLWHYI